MSYYIDLSLISLDEHKRTIMEEYQIPSFRTLRDDIDNRFDKFRKLGINNLDELRKLLKSKKQDLIVSEKTGIPEKYIATLRREINSYLPPARKIVDFNTVSDDLKLKLKEKNVKTTVDLYDYLIEFKSPKQISNDLNEDDEIIIYLAKLCDLSRMRYVSPIFAITLAYTDYSTISKIQNADPENLYKQMLSVNEKYNLYKGKVGLNDVKFLIQDSKRIKTDFMFML